MNKLNMEIASLMERFPFIYPAAKFNTAQKRFKVILNEMLLRGIACNINTTRHTRFLGSTYYTYNIHLDYKLIQKQYKTKAAAKQRVFREYLKIKAHGKEENNRQEADEH